MSSDEKSSFKSLASRAVSSFKWRIVDVEVALSEFLKACRAKDELKMKETLTVMRKAVLFQGIQESNEDIEYDDETQSHMSLRGRVWKAFLGVHTVNAQEYMDLVDKGTSSRYDKIRGDSFRTFPEEKMFKDRVPEKSIIRVCNSYVHRFPKMSYLQGMNAICAPLLYSMPEVDAFYAFIKVINEKSPLYWLNDTAGAVAGCHLVDEVLKVVDSQLAKHLQKTPGLTARVYAFSAVSSLSASVPPFEELMKLWDFLIAFGLHLNIVCVVAQMILMRDQLLATSNPNSLLNYRKWPHLRARAVISITMSLLPRIPSDLFDKICRHATDPVMAAKLIGRDKVKFDATFVE